MLDEVHHRIGEHLGVHPEVLLVAQCQCDRGGDGADPQLDRRAMLDQLGDVLTDPPLDLAKLTLDVLVGVDADLGRVVDLRDVDERVAQGTWHPVVELGDHQLARSHRSKRCVYAGPQRAEAVGVGRGDVDQDRVERQDARAEEARHVGEEDGDVFGASLVDRGARIGADEERLVAEMAGHLGRKVWRGSLRVEVEDADVLELRSAFDQRVEQDRWGGRSTVDEELLPGADDGNRLSGRYDLHAASLGREPECDGVTKGSA